MCRFSPFWGRPLELAPFVFSLLHRTRLTMLTLIEQSSRRRADRSPSFTRLVRSTILTFGTGLSRLSSCIVLGSTCLVQWPIEFACEAHCSHLWCERTNCATCSMAFLSAPVMLGTCGLRKASIAFLSTIDQISARFCLRRSRNLWQLPVPLPTCKAWGLTPGPIQPQLPPVFHLPPRSPMR